METSLLDILASYNRKERFILLTQVSAGEDSLPLSAAFRAKLNALLGEGHVPEQVPLMAMDFHLNWLYAGLWQAAGGTVGSAMLNPLFPPGEPSRGRRALEPNQEDIDLLLGWPTGDRTTLLLVEAKAHSGWSTSQMRSKADRLMAILYSDPSVSQFVRSKVDVHLLLAGIRLPQKPHFFEGWPEEVTELNTGADGGRLLLKLDPPTSVLRLVGRDKAVQEPSWSVREMPRPAEA